MTNLSERVRAEMTTRQTAQTRYSSPSRREHHRTGREIHYLSVEGISGYEVGDVIVDEHGHRSLAIRDGHGISLVRD
jgi:hypothetical protein